MKVSSGFSLNLETLTDPAAGPHHTEACMDYALSNC